MPGSREMTKSHFHIFIDDARGFTGIQDRNQETKFVKIFFYTYNRACDQYLNYKFLMADEENFH